jgi:hypothetical protein
MLRRAIMLACRESRLYLPAKLVATRVTGHVVAATTFLNGSLAFGALFGIGSKPVAGLDNHGNHDIHEAIR